MTGENGLPKGWVKDFGEFVMSKWRNTSTKIHIGMVIWMDYSKDLSNYKEYL